MFHIKGISGIRERAGRIWKGGGGRQGRTQRNAVNGGNRSHTVKKGDLFSGDTDLSGLDHGVGCGYKAGRWIFMLNPPLQAGSVV